MAHAAARTAPSSFCGSSPRPGDNSARSLLELADRRLEGLIDSGHRYICTAEGYRAAIREQLPAYADPQIFGEPAPRDTVNAVGLAAAILAKEDEDAVFAVLTADHVIEPEAMFRERMDLGFRLVENNPHRFVTFSIKPTYPATGFGYVERGTPIRDKKHGKHPAIDGNKEHAYHVARFVEKPDRPRAEVYVQKAATSAGTRACSSGRPRPSSKSSLGEVQARKPRRPDENPSGLGRQKGQRRTRRGVPPHSPKSASITPSAEPGGQRIAQGRKPRGQDARFSVCTVQMDLQWLDVGSWPSFAETVKGDKAGNRASGDGTPIIMGGKNNLVVTSPGHTVAVLGVEDSDRRPHARRYPRDAASKGRRSSWRAARNGGREAAVNFELRCQA